MKKSMRLRISALLFAVLLLVCALLLPASAAGPKYDANDITVTLRMSADGQSYPGQYLKQGSLTLSNLTENTLEGTAELHFCVSYYYGNPSKEDSTTLVLPLELTPGITKTTDFTVDFANGADACRVELHDKNGKLLRTEEFSLMENDAPLLFGWMSDTPKEAAIFQQKNANIICEALTPDYFPADFEMMKRYAIIIVNNIDLSASSAYTPKQIALLKKFIEEGGTVIVGTGTDTAVLQSFSEYFQGPVENAVQVSAESFQGLAYYADANEFFQSILDFPAVSGYSGKNYELYDNFGPDGKSFISLEFKKVSSCTVNDPNFTECPSLTESAFRIYKSTQSNLYISGVNLAAPALLQSSQSDAFLTGIFSVAGIADSCRLLESTPALISENELSGIGSTVLNPAIPVILLLTYAGVGILLPFILAKSKKKPRIAIVGIPAASVAFAMAVILFGVLRHGFVPYAETIDIVALERNGEATVYCSAKNAAPGSGTRTVSFGVEGTGYYTVPSQYTRTYGGTPLGYRVSAVGEGFVEGPAAASWQDQFAYGYYRTAYSGALDVQLTPEDDSHKTYLIKVTNNTGKNLKDVAVFALGNTVLIGDLPAGAEYSGEKIPVDKANFLNYEEVMRTFFYEPHHLDDWDMQEDMGNIVHSQLVRISLGGVLYTTPECDMRHLADKSQQDALDAVGLLHVISTHYLDSEDTVFIFGIDADSASNLSIDGKRVGKNVHSTVVTQTIPIAGTAKNALQEERENADFTISEDSMCNTTTWKKGYVELYPQESALFLCPLTADMKRSEQIPVQIQSEAPEKYEVYAVALSPYSDYAKAFRVKTDVEGISVILTDNLMDTLNEYYDPYGYKYNYRDYEIMHSIVFEHNELYLNTPITEDQLALIVFNPTSQTISIKGVTKNVELPTEQP